MAEYTMGVNQIYNIPNLTVYNKYCDGEHYAFRIVSNIGYVIQDITEEPHLVPVFDEEGNLVVDENGLPVETEVIWYYRSVDIPLMQENSITNYVAVSENSVPDPDNQIFGGEDNNDHEVM